MKLATWKSTVTLAVALGPSIACATHEDPPTSPPVIPDPGSTFEAGAGDASADVSTDGSSGCSESGFCYVNVPARGPLIAVSASSSDDAWMLPQQSGSLLRWNGTEVKEAYHYEGTSPSGIQFAGIWAHEKDDVWAVANGADGHLFLVRYASAVGGGLAAFRELRTEEPSALPVLWAAPGAGVLWIATGRSILRVHEDAGGAVMEHMDPRAGAEDATHYAWHGVWGFGPEDVYVAGSACPSEGCDESKRRGRLAHYDGSAWSITAIDSVLELLSLRGAGSGATRRLWYHCREEERALDPAEIVVKTYLVPLTADGRPGPPLFQHSMKNAPACSSRVGYAGAPESGWFSDGFLLCRWTGASFEPAGTLIGGRPRISAVNDIWANDADEAWIVGTAIARTNLPQGPFAARRTASTAKGGDR